MKKYLTRNQVSLCHKNTCIHAKVKNADLLAAGAFFALILIGISALNK